MIQLVRPPTANSKSKESRIINLKVKGAAKLKILGGPITTTKNKNHYSKKIRITTLGNKNHYSLPKK